MAAPGMTLEERQRIERQVAAASSARLPYPGGAVKSSGHTQPSTAYSRVEQSILLERLLASSTAEEFFRQPPFSLTSHASQATVDNCYRKAGRLIREFQSRIGCACVSLPFC